MSTSPVSPTNGMSFSAPLLSMVQNKDELYRILKIVLPIVVALGVLLLLPTLTAIPITLAIGFGAGYLHQKKPEPTTAPPETENPSGSTPVNTDSGPVPSSILPPPAPANKEIPVLSDGHVFELLTKCTISGDTINIPCGNDKDKAKALVKYLKTTKIVDDLAKYNKQKYGDTYSVYVTAKKRLLSKSPIPANILLHLQDVVSSKL